MLSIFFLFLKFIYLFIFGCVQSLLLPVGFLQLQLVGATLPCSARTSHCSCFPLLWSTGSRHMVFSSCGMQAQQLWLTGLVAPWHVGSSQTRAQTRIPHIGRQILNHCATREVRASFHVPVGHLYVFFGKMSVQVFCPFFDWVVVSLLLSCMSCLYILEIKPLLVASFANNFSHSIGCLFVLFMVSFAVQKLISLIRSHLFIFAFISIALGD